MTDHSGSSIIWGVELSPFVLKLQACLQYTQQAYRRLPDEGSYLENTKTMLFLAYAKKLKLITRFPQIDVRLDEYPAVPFFSNDGKHFQYDSSSIAHWLDSKNPTSQLTLFPESESLNFIASLIDEAFDEFGLYMVHHMRWIGSAKSNQMGKLLAKEFRHALPPGGPFYLSKSFPRRQVRRCPYLFSVAPKRYRSGVNKHLTPPQRPGFPETHTLLNESWTQYLKGMEEVLSHQAYLLGDCFTIADASAYGQLAMNLVDPEAAAKMKHIAPLTFTWLNRIYQGKHLIDAENLHNKDEKRLYISKHLIPLLGTIMSTFSTLMVHNERAYIQAKQSGETLFNEAAFNQNRALYDGQLRGYPYRTVVKTFQVRTWRALCEQWSALPPADQAEIRNKMGLCELFGPVKK
jgi:glutathione S-transferase